MWKEFGDINVLENSVNYLLSLDYHAHIYI